MIRKIICNLLYDYAKLLSHIADAMAPMNDQIWRDRAWRQWDYQRHYVSPCAEKHYAPRPPTE
jgi:hypothetical protein